MVRIAIVTGSTRPGRRVDQVVEWVHARAVAGKRDAEFDILDIAEFGLPMLDEPQPAALGEYQNSHTRRWAQAVDGYDGFIFVTPEYNHSMPGALKNAIDYLFREWNDKAAGFVSYGVNGGIRAVEHLRLSLAELKVACVRSQVALLLFTDFDITDPLEPGIFRPGDNHGRILDRMFDEVVAWSGALRPLRGGVRAGS